MTTRAISLFFAVASAAAYAFTHVESAACYASRYPELHERFCLNDICDTRALHDSSWFRKQKAVQVDKTKKKPPQDINKLG